jgi:thiol-disulfide isomerase/thioredoxin
MKYLTSAILPAVLLAWAAFLLHGEAARSDDGQSASNVKLERLNWKQFQARLAADKKIRYTIVDAWSTTCGPCKENFPHLVEMHRKFSGQGLAVISLSLDDPTDQAAVGEAEKFLKARKAAFTNILLEENLGDGFEKLNINAIPAVFIFAPDGKEVKRFTMDDPNKQFTYDQVEKTIVALLDSKP